MSNTHPQACIHVAVRYFSKRLFADPAPLAPLPASALSLAFLPQAPLDDSTLLLAVTTSLCLLIRYVFTPGSANTPARRDAHR